VTRTGDGVEISEQLLRRLHWVEPWYVAYGLLGAAAGGLAPILLPLKVSLTGSATHVGLVMAAFNLGGLLAPVWGGLADRLRIHRWLLVGGLLANAAGLILFPFIASLGVWIALALLQGIGMAGAATVANLFVVEGHPKRQWDERIGWLQTFYGGGQVIGLLLAGAFSQSNLRLGLLVAGGLTVVGSAVGGILARTPPGSRRPRPVLLDPARHLEWPFSSPQRLFHHLTAAARRKFFSALRSPLGFFFVIWLVGFGGSQAVFSLYPVLMQSAYSVKPNASSTAYAIAAGLGLLLYSPAGRLSDRAGLRPVFDAGLGLRLLAFAGLASLAFVSFPAQNWAAMGSFTVVVLSWSLLSVTGTALTARLSDGGEGEALGAFNAITAVAGVAGSSIGGWAANRWGYVAVPIVAAGGVLLALALALVGGALLKTSDSSDDESGAG
jgi:DHA1 family tetracycline resistance protein-like MFS transporter